MAFGSSADMLTGSHRPKPTRDPDDGTRSIVRIWPASSIRIVRLILWLESRTLVDATAHLPRTRKARALIADDPCGAQATTCPGDGAPPEIIGCAGPMQARASRDRSRIGDGPRTSECGYRAGSAHFDVAPVPRQRHPVLTKDAPFPFAAC